MFEVVAGCRGSEPDVGYILLLLGLQCVRHFGGLADADDEDARRQRIERAGVADLDFRVSQIAEREFDLAHHVRGGPSERFVDHGDVALFEIDAPQIEFGGAHRLFHGHGVKRGN